MAENEYGCDIAGDERRLEQSDNRSRRLRNDDFRKLLMTPRSAPAWLPATPAHTPAHSPSSVGDKDGGDGEESPRKKISFYSKLEKQEEDKRTELARKYRGRWAGERRDGANPDSAHTPSSVRDKDGEDRAERRRKKKSFYANLMKQEEDKRTELSQKYRDRARERRDGADPGYQAEDPLSTATGYRSVAPDLKSGMDAAERRRQMIKESKFLGGDMEHTHLVKGLDCALLQKVRNEIQEKEKEECQEIHNITKCNKEKKDHEQEMQFKTKLGRSVYGVLFNMKVPETNDLFSPGRMAYTFDLEDEFAENDIPTTLIRSRVDVPTLEATATLTTNDIVINKIIETLSFLRLGGWNRKSQKKGKGRTVVKGEKIQGESIYGDIGDYVPSMKKKDGCDEGKEKRHGSYFEKPSDDIWSDKPVKSDLHKGDAETLALKKDSSISNQSRAQQLLTRLADKPEAYAECYPGFEEMQDAVDDSDDEVDYTKMDLGNKKGPIGRWDFDTQEEYSEYMNSKEALPKAAFQYGVKMADGRRTRKYHKEKNEKAELDREWQKIQNIIQKRKIPGQGIERVFKKPKY